MVKLDYHYIIHGSNSFEARGNADMSKEIYAKVDIKWAK